MVFDTLHTRKEKQNILVFTIFLLGNINILPFFLSTDTYEKDLYFLAQFNLNNVCIHVRSFVCNCIK